MLSRPLLYLHMHAPPTPGGSPVLLHRLLNGLPPSELEIVTARNLRRLVRARGPLVLRGRYHFVPKKGLAGNRFRLGRAANAAVNVTLAKLAGVTAARIAGDTGAGWTLTVADEGFSVIAGDLCARRAEIPHVIMIFDLWEENAYSGPERRIAADIEPLLFPRAAKLLVHCREMADHYRRKHGLEAAIVPTTVELWQPGPRPPREQPYEVLFVGTVYWAQQDALRRLTRACRSLPDVRLTVVGSQGAGELRAFGVEPDRVEPSLPQEALRRRLEQADVLFLGLSFDSPHPDVIHTASPAKLPEYMASGTPILIHAPRGSHVAEYAREGEFAEVVDEASDERLAAAIRRVLDDQATAGERAARARGLAEKRHDVEVVRARFCELLEALR